jgi:hypothetical protein
LTDFFRYDDDPVSHAAQRRYEVSLLDLGGLVGHQLKTIWFGSESHATAPGSSTRQPAVHHPSCSQRAVMIIGTESHGVARHRSARLSSLIYNLIRRIAESRMPKFSRVPQGSS